jgi:hypothetical protein
MNSENLSKIFENKNIKTSIGELTFLNAINAKKVDDLLMGPNYGYSIDQLMEIAGLSVAKAIDDAIRTEENFSKSRKILCISGPGSKLFFLVFLNILEKTISFKKINFDYFVFSKNKIIIKKINNQI